ncbi:hypothetical protein E2C01_005358 [Portunus trituberculatus]|uniref:Uncharacterized protein n=1 Tax=Portunus trituberculatus TaxID=210409 RepID=A0A5B7CTV1_PORTR|nr:hypothetical protein [Portunus trituberculatus]
MIRVTEQGILFVLYQPHLSVHAHHSLCVSTAPELRIGAIDGYALTRHGWNSWLLQKAAVRTPRTSPQHS